MKTKILHGLTMILFIYGLAIIPLPVRADDTTDAGAMGFIYETKYPENQKKDVGYFDLKMNPGQKQTVQIILKNPSTEEITVEVARNSAKTNMNGVLEYGPTKLKKDASLKYDFADLVKAPDEITIPPNAEKTLDLAIQMPEVRFDGVIVGGIQLKKADDKQADKQKGASVVNKYAYIIAMVLQETETEVKPDMKLNQVYAGQANYRNVIYTDVSNSQATFLNHLSMEVQIMKETSDEVLYEAKKTDMRMAPNSNMTFPVSLQGERMLPGKYRARVLATSGEQKWEWIQKFTITNQEADKFNREDISLVQPKDMQWGLIVGVAVGVFVLVLLIYYLLRRIRKNRK